VNEGMTLYCYTVTLYIILIYFRVSSPKIENSVINYSHLCRSKHARPLFIFKTEIFVEI